MLIALQIACLVLMSIFFGVSACAAWLGLGPEMSFLDFLKQGETLVPLFGLLTVLGSVLAFVLGWEPEVAFSKWIRAKILLPMFANVRWLSAISGILLAALVGEAFFIFSFGNRTDAEITDSILSGNFDLADQLIAANENPSQRIADLFFFNDSERQLYLKSTGNPDQHLCRIYHAYFEDRRKIFQQIWTRYALHLSKGACLEVLEDPGKALNEYQKALKLAEWIDAKQGRLVSRRVAALYLHDSKGYSDIPDSAQRAKRVIALLATDPDPTATRMRGTANYFLGEYAKAAQEWEQAEKTVPAADFVERKKLLNNLGLAYSRIEQTTLALSRIDAGLELPFDEEDESQRKEQIRLLASKLDILRRQKNCLTALNVFEQREKLKRQERSPCTALIEAQIYACIVESDDAAPSRAKLLDALLFAVQQDRRSFVDRTEPAITALVEQSALKFKECYVGLQYDLEAVRRAALKLAH